MTPSHTTTGEWQSFETRMRRRRAERLAVRAEVAAEAGCMDDAWQCVEEARLLSPAAIVETEKKLHALASRLVNRAVSVVPADTAPERKPPAVPLARPAIPADLLIRPAPLPVAAVDAGDVMIDRPAAVGPIRLAAAPGLFQDQSEPRPTGTIVVAIAAMLLLAGFGGWGLMRAQLRGAIPPPSDRSEVAAPAATVPGNEQPQDVPSIQEPVPASLAAGGSSAAPQPAAQAGETPQVTRAFASQVGTTGIAADLPPVDTGAPAMPPAEAPRELPAAPPATVPALDPAVAALPAPVGETASTELPQEPLVRGVLDRYASAFSDLDADAARRVWPTVNRDALIRAFDALASQRVSLGECRIDVAAATAEARCAGVATWVPKVGNGSVRTEPRIWTFDLARAAGGWQIVSARVQNR